MTGNTLRKGFSRWEEHWVDGRRRQNSIVRILSRMSHKLVSSAFEKWVDEVEEGSMARERKLKEQRADEIVERHIARLMQKSLAVCLSTWRVCTVEAIVAQSC